MLLEVLVLRLEPVLLGLAASPLPAEKPSGSFVAEVVLSLLLAIVVLALVATGSWYWLKQRVLASGQPAESNAPQGFDNITFRDVRTGVKGSCLPPTTSEQHVPKSSANPSSFPPGAHTLATSQGGAKGSASYLVASERVTWSCRTDLEMLLVPSGSCSRKS